MTLPQIREEMSRPDLHIFTLKFLAVKKRFFSHFRGERRKETYIFFIKKRYYATFHCGRFLDPKKVKKRALKNCS